jgi:adenylate cyclase
MRLVLALPVLVLFLLHATGILRLGFIERLEGMLYDERVRLTAPGGIDPRIVIVDIDDKSLTAEGHWPWRRDKLAALMNRLFDDYSAKLVGFDVLFPERDESSALALIGELERDPVLATPALKAGLDSRRPQFESNRLFAESLIARDVVLGFVFKARVERGDVAELNVLPKPIELAGVDVSAVPWIAPAGYIGNLKELQDNAGYGGFFDEPLTDDDGIVRRLPLIQRYHERFYPSLGFACAYLALGAPPIKLAFAQAGAKAAELRYLEIGGRQIPVDRHGALLAPFRGGAGSFPYVSATQVLRGTANAAVLKDAIVLIGTSAPGLNDLRTAPVGKDYPGVEAHANLIAGILDGAIRFEPSFARGFEIAGLVLIALLAAFWLPRFSPLAVVAAIGTALTVVIGVNLIAWIFYGAVLPLASLISFMLIESVLLLVYGYFIEQRRKRRQSRIFGQYVPPEIVRELDENETEASLAGESREMSVLFSDVRGFTTISEGLEPRALTQLMNEFLTPITGVIQAHRGTIDKYMGDAVMAFWGAPLANPRHARDAVLAALGMIATMRELAPGFRARGWPELKIGVGVSTGVMNVGNMGSSFRIAYTVLGDTVNLGSRLEGVTKQYGVDIIVSANTAAAVPEVVFREIDRVRVKGKHEPIAIYEPLGLKSEAGAAVTEAASSFSAALAAYRGQRWEEAEHRLMDLVRANSHPLYELYLGRIRHFRAHAPAASWDGVWAFESK